MIRVLLACRDPSYCHRLSVYLDERADFLVCGQVPVTPEVLHRAAEQLPDVAILESDRADDLEVAVKLKLVVPDVSLLLVAGEVSSETEKMALTRGIDAVFRKDDDLAALALNTRAIYELAHRNR